MNELLLLPVEVIFPHHFHGPMLLPPVLILLGIGKIRLVNGILVKKQGFHPSLIWNLPLLWLKAFYSHVIAICITEKNPRNEGPHEATQWQQ